MGCPSLSYKQKATNMIWKGKSRTMCRYRRLGLCEQSKEMLRRGRRIAEFNPRLTRRSITGNRGSLDEIQAIGNGFRVEGIRAAEGPQPALTSIDAPRKLRRSRSRSRSLRPSAAPHLVNLNRPGIGATPSI